MEEEQQVEAINPPVVVETRGEWQQFEVVTEQELEVGKTYRITFDGICEIALSEDEPSGGITTNSIEYKKDNNLKLWIRTAKIGEEE